LDDVYLLVLSSEEVTNDVGVDAELKNESLLSSFEGGSFKAGGYYG